MTRAARHPARLTPIALALACLGTAPAFAQSLLVPGGGTPVAGSVTIGTPTLANGVLTLGINQSSTRAIVNWSTFSIGSQSAVNVVQPSAASVLLNRVTGAQASVIAGRLTSTLAGNAGAVGGSVYLINPNGVTFANGAVVNTGGLLASTLDIDGPDQTTRNASFMSGGVIDPATGRAQLGFANGGSAGAVGVDAGATVTAGSITMMGASVRNAGTLQAGGGAVNLGAAQRMALVVDPVGDGLTTLRIVDPATVSALVENTGTITADGGLVALRAASTAAETVVRQGGVLRARSIGSRGGQIVLDGSAGNGANVVEVTGGSIDATGGTLAGGSVSVTGQRVRLTAGSIDASGASGGGVTAFGEQSLTMSPDATLAASGTAGAGGQVSVGAETAFTPVTVFNPSTGITTTTTFTGGALIGGQLTARGTTDGGSITTAAGALQVSRGAIIDAAGGSGANGRWTAATSRDLTITASVTQGDPVYDPNGFPSRTANSAVADAAIGTSLSRSTDVVMNAVAGSSTGSGLVNGIVFGFGARIVKASGGHDALTFNSDRNITLQANGIVAVQGAGALDVDLDADAHGTAIAGNAPITGASDATARTGYISLFVTNIATQGGNIRLYGQGDPVLGRAFGGISNSNATSLNGIYIGSSLLDTCVGTACGGSGSILLRGQGATTNDFNGQLASGAGIDLEGMTLRTSTGSIRLDGLGGLGSDGISMHPPSGQSVNAAALLQSVSGDIRLTGRSRDWVVGEVGGAYQGSTVQRAISGSSAGVAMSKTGITTGGSVIVSGTGGDLSTALTDPAFLSGVSSRGAVFDGSGGVDLLGSSISAGTGATISLAGLAGSRGFTIFSGSGQPTPNSADPFAVAVFATPTNGFAAAGGSVVVDGGRGDVSLQQLFNDPSSSSFIDAVGTTPRSLIDVTGTGGSGGRIALTGRNLLVQGDAGNTARLDANGSSGGGSVSLHAMALAGQAASGVLAVDSHVVMAANATSAGDGGTVTLLGDATLRAYGSLQASGAGAAGSGGSLLTSGAALDLAGVRVAAAGARANGHWTIDPYDITVVHGSASGSLPTNPFAAVAASTVQDGDINNALAQGISVTVSTGTGGSPFNGDILFDRGVLLTPSSGGVAGQTLEFDAQRSIRSLASNVAIGIAGTSPLNVVFKADANASGPSVGGGQVSYDGAVFSNGGTVTMSGNWSAAGGGDTALHLTGIIDTRVTSNASGLGGDLTLTGLTTTPVANLASDQPGVWLNGATLRTGSGNVAIVGSSTNNTGVRIDGSLTQGIVTGTGNVTVTGQGASVPGNNSGATLQSDGVRVAGAAVASTSGRIVLRGNVADTTVANSTAAGILLSDGGAVRTTGASDIELTGSAAADGRGLWVQAPASTAPVVAVSSGRHLVLRAGNDGTADAITLAAPVRAADAIDLRPGAVDASGAGIDRVASPITLGAGATRGFAVSDTDMAQLSAARIVTGSSTQSGSITVTGALQTSAALTLQNGAGGSIQLNGPVTAANLALLSAGSIAQAATAPITTGNLMVRSSAGNVDLQSNANNASVVGGGASGNFNYIDTDAVRVASVTASGFDAATGLPTPQTAPTLDIGSGLIGTVTQDLTIATDLNVATLLALNAAGSLRSASPGVTIQAATSGPMVAIFNAAQIDYAGSVFSNGGDVAMSGVWRLGGATDSALHLSGTVDTRVGRSDAAGRGGNVQLTGFSTTAAPDPTSAQPGIWLQGSTISTAGGNIDINGASSNNTGVRIDGTGAGQGLFTTGGNINVQALGTDTPAAGSGTPTAVDGAIVSGASLRTGSGAITLRGNVADVARAGSASSGVLIGGGAVVTTTAGGAIELTGSAGAGGRGVWVQANPATGGATTTVNGSGNLVLRASNDGSADAITLAAPVVAAGVVDLRPGAFTTARAAVDATSTPIMLGAGAATGFALSDADMAQLAAARIVVGSDAHAGNITVVGALATTAALTLQDGAGGSIQLNAPVTAAGLGLVSAGNVAQSATAGITSTSLLARSSGGNVDLQSVSNHVDRVGGGASGSFAYVDADALDLAAVSATGWVATSNLPTTIASTTLNAGSLLARTLTQDLSLRTGIASAGNVDLVAGSRFQNPAGASITAARWNVWADTWAGESRGGLAGSGPLPNLYGCAYPGGCGVAIPATGNHFLYAARPTATVTVGDGTREVGAPDPVFSVGIGGLINGDSAAAFSGTPQSTANVTSPAGTYAVGGNFVSAAGYLVNVTPGRLVVTAAPPSFLSVIPAAQIFYDTSNIYTYTFDYNFGPAAICAASGPLDGDRASTGNDVLAREWTRVRSRPNLTSCVATERRNGCNDF